MSMIPKPICVAFSGYGPRILSFGIVILLLAPFQLSIELNRQASAAGTLPVLEASPRKGASLPGIEQAIQAYGHQSSSIREEDFALNITPQNTPHVIVPLGKPMNPNTLNILARYINHGGQVILIPIREELDASSEKLLSIVGIRVNGSAFATKAMPLHWKGRAIPLSDTLPAGSRILTVAPGVNTHVVATWGRDYPAIIKTDKGALLNWQWGRHLSEATNALALSQVAPLTGSGQAALAAIRREALAGVPFMESSNAVPAEIRQVPMKAPIRPSTLGAAIIRKNQKPVDLASASASSLPKSSNSVLTPVKIIPKTEAKRIAAVPLSPLVSPEGQMVQSQRYPRQEIVEIMNALSAPDNSWKPAPTKIAQAVPPAANGQSASPRHEDDEVLQNILGTSPAPAANNKTVDPTLDDKLDAAEQGEPKTNASSGRKGEAGQKHFSFLDPEARDLLAPEFDYGVYSMNMRVLDDYRKRIMDALESGKQLSLNLPEDKVRGLLQESDKHKRQFEALYLNNKTTEGLDEFGLARKYTLQALALTSASPRVEGRAIWLDRGTIVDAANPAGVQKLMQKLHRAGINVVYFETLNAGFPIYPSKVLPRQNPLINGWDPLKTAVEEGHRLGMEVHAWVWVFAVGNRRHNPLVGMPGEYPGPVLTEGGLMNEAMRNREGGLGVDGRQNEFWLSPASPKARDLLLNVFKEIVSTYDVDGLHLDYIRYPFQTRHTRMGFESVARERFAQSTGSAVGAADDYNSKLWIAWKTYQINSFVQQISETTRRIKPHLKLSAAVFPMKRDARIVAIQQDWETWVDNGWIDVLNPMSYTTDPDRLQSLFSYVQSSPKRHVLVYPGVALHRMDGGHLVLQLEALRERGSLGATLFAGAHLDAEKVEALGTGPFKESNSLPPHRDVVKSLQMILSDYEQKFNKLRTEGVLNGVPAAQSQALQDAVAQLSGTLKGMGDGKSVTQISSQKLQLARQQFLNLQSAHQTWTEQERTTHPFRAQYFDKGVLLLSELLGYLNDKVVIAGNGHGAGQTAFKPPVLPATGEASAQPVGSTHPGLSAEHSEPTPDEEADLKGILN
jgi:uncharacterized lipoprotein YddW (UPF0748 family)